MARDPSPVLITGCSTGIGRATAQRMARAGHTVYATARCPETLEGLRADGCHVLRLDLEDEASLEKAVRHVEQEHGAVGTLVNNAGYAEICALETLSAQRLRRQYETNVFGPLRLVQLALPAMRAAGRGRMVNVGSIGDRCVFPLWGAYTSSKHALSALNDTLRMETAAHGIDVVLIEPGLITTHFSRSIDRNMDGQPDSATYRAEVSRFRATLQDVLHSTVGGPAPRAGHTLRGAVFSRLSGSPDDAARTVMRAAIAPRPRPHYYVPVHARLAFAAQALLPARAWDGAVRGMFLGSERPSEARKLIQNCFPRSEAEA